MDELFEHKTPEKYLPKCHNMITGVGKQEIYIPIDSVMDILRDIFSRIRISSEDGGEDQAWILSDLCKDITACLQHCQKLKDFDIVKFLINDKNFEEDEYDDEEDDLLEFLKGDVFEDD